MHIPPNHHLTYCTNIHSGETWAEVQDSLRYVLEVRDKLGVAGAFGIGLRLSARAAEELARSQVLSAFKDWLARHDCYVFTMNGFPYGDFHGEVVKDQVHAPDWTTQERLEYTIRLFDILAELLPEGMTGGVSTSPLSYEPWHTDAAAHRKVLQVSADHLAQVVDHLHDLHERTGKLLHLDIEPEPDGMLEDCAGFVSYYNNYLLRQGREETIVRRHLRICFDVCHFAVNFESPRTVLRELHRQEIKVGKLQISAALKVDLRRHGAATVKAALAPYAEPIYLHQATLRYAEQDVIAYPDLAPALADLEGAFNNELRTHFHVPIYTDNYGVLQSTNDAIVETLNIWRTEPFTHHLEIETYTWNVLPDHQQLGLTDSIARELKWVLPQLKVGMESATDRTLNSEQSDHAPRKGSKD